MRERRKRILWKRKRGRRRGRRRERRRRRGRRRERWRKEVVIAVSELQN